MIMSPFSVPGPSETTPRNLVVTLTSKSPVVVEVAGLEAATASLADFCRKKHD